MLAHLLHIRPWEIDRLSREEFASACAWVDRHIADQAQPTGGA